jgi:hypothetical protein
MRNKYNTYFLIFFIAQLSALGLKGQNISSGAYEEIIVLSTDRNLFVAGEQLLFSAHVFVDGLEVKEGVSKILYCELVTPDGLKISDGKFQINNIVASGFIAIPGEITTGLYYVRAYTKFMRNNGPGSYTYVPVKIINPVKTSFLQGNGSDSSLKAIQNRPESSSEGMIQIKTDANVYERRSQVKLSILSNTGSLNNRFCICVVPLNSAFSKQVHCNTLPKKSTSFFYPETRGISLTGRLINKKNGAALAFSDISLTMIDNRDFIPINADSAGRFFFALPDQTGKRDLLICTSVPDSVNPEILVDNDFCPEKYSLPSPVFTLDSTERAVATPMVNNMQIEHYYKSKESNDTVVVTPEPFYGKASIILQLDKYIQLPTLEEYFSELTSIVRVRKSGKKQHFSISGSTEEMSVFAPLLMIDLVAVDQTEKILAIPPATVSRIEIVNEPYIKGDIIYGGIISIISKKNDFAGIDLPSSGLFINYRFLSDMKDDQLFIRKPVNIPDTRNTLYWAPNVELPQGKESVHNFFTADSPGIYQIRVSGIRNDGTIVTGTQTFSVK